MDLSSVSQSIRLQLKLYLGAPGRRTFLPLVVGPETSVSNFGTLMLDK
jgi:hypothetical protein